MTWMNAETRSLELFHYNIRAFFTHETFSTPTPSYLMCRNLSACPAPDWFKAGKEVGILL
jgi:hypothetical protein